MAPALYYPFSRCLSATALKRALLLHDELVFVDAVSPEERADLYAREAAVDPDIDSALARRWRTVEPHYRLLEQERVVRTVDPATLFDVDGVVGEIAQGLEVDLNRNGGSELFGRREPWSMLERRLPGGGADGRSNRGWQTGCAGSGREIRW